MLIAIKTQKNNETTRSSILISNNTIAIVTNSYTIVSVDVCIKRASKSMNVDFVMTLELKHY